MLVQLLLVVTVLGAGDAGFPQTPCFSSDVVPLRHELAGGPLRPYACRMSRDDDHVAVSDLLGFTVIDAVRQHLDGRDGAHATIALHLAALLDLGAVTAPASVARELRQVLALIDAESDANGGDGGAGDDDDDFEAEVRRLRLVGE